MQLAEVPSYNQPMSEPALYPRFAAPRLREALDESPVVLIHGPRQCGKTTLARHVAEPLGYGYLSFDDTVVRSAADSDPMGFVADLPDRVILDEVQRVPGLFAAIKDAVDRSPSFGRFLLTGSANVLLLPKLSDSLAGRMEVLRLFPLAQCELERTAPDFLRRLFEADFPVRRSRRLGDELRERILAGGYPRALTRSSPHRRSAWYRDYVEALVQRDVQEMRRIEALDLLPRLLAYAAAHTAQLLNVSALATPFQVSRPTIDAYLTLLERVFLLERLPSWHSNRAKRLVKTPKLHLTDTGVACALLGIDQQALASDGNLVGPLLESFVQQELCRHASWYPGWVTFHHFRDRDGAEVDLVLEREGRSVAGVEVKASGTVTAGDFRGLRKLASAAGSRFAAGVVLYDGEVTVGFGDRLHAVPIRTLWEG